MIKPYYKLFSNKKSWGKLSKNSKMLHQVHPISHVLFKVQTKIRRKHVFDYCSFFLNPINRSFVCQ